MRLLPVLVVLLTACLGACKDRSASAPPATATTTTSGSGSGIATASGPISEADARAFAERLAVESMPCDATKLATRVAAGAADPAVVARLYCEWLAGIASYKLIRVRTVAGEPRPILRRLIADPNSGAMFVAFDELVLTRAPGSGEVALADVYSFRQGVSISDLVGANAGSASAVTPTDYLGASSRHPDVRAARDKLRDGDRAATLAAIDKLPPDVRKERGVQMLRVRAAVGADKTAYKQALTELAQTFPDDPGIALIQIDGALDLGDADAASQWIDVLERVTGPDAYLESTRVIALVRKGDLDAALERANAAVALEPTLTRALEIKLDVLIARKQWDDALATMTTLETDHGMRFDIEKLRKEPRLAPLVATPAFAQWLEARNNR